MRDRQGEVIHEQDRDGEDEVDPQIVLTVGKDPLGQSHGPQQGAHKSVAQQHHHRAHYRIGEDEHGEVLPGLPLLALAHLPHDHRAAAGGQQTGYRCNETNGRGGEIDGGQGVRANEIGHK